MYLCLTELLCTLTKTFMLYHQSKAFLLNAQYLAQLVVLLFYTVTPYAYLAIYYLFTCFCNLCSKIRIYKPNFLLEMSLPFKCQLLYMKAQLESSIHWQKRALLFLWGEVGWVLSRSAALGQDVDKEIELPMCNHILQLLQQQ